MGWHNFKGHFRFDTGFRSKTSFWEDVWYGESSLKDSFLGFFNIARCREASIADNMEHSNGIVLWNIVFTCLIHDWEVEVIASFYSRLYSYKFRGVGEDKLWWVPSSKGSFKVRSFYRVLMSHGPFLFLGKAFRRPRLHLEWHFLLGRLLEVRSAPLTICAEEA
jgi:hypothetical protein